MCFPGNFSQGSTIIVDFILNGEQHQSVRWTSHPSLYREWATCEQFKQEIRSRYEAKGAEVVAIKVIEAVEVEVS